MGQFALGQPVQRFEDPRLLTGRGNYVSDVQFHDQLHGYVFRSPHAHATLLSLDIDAARQAPGVVAILTHEDIKRAGLGTTHPHLPRKRPKDGSPDYARAHPGLIPVGERVRIVGDPIAFVVAETLEQAKDAAELIVADYDILPSITETVRAADNGVVQLYEDFPNNISTIAEAGNKEATEAAFATAKHVVKQRFVVNRITTASMETRGSVGVYDAHEDRYTLYCDTQGPHGSRTELAHDVFKIPEYKLRIVARDIGGAFGLKGTHFPENRLTLLAAKLTGRPVKWVSDRSESFISDDHARDCVTDAELALDEQGNFIGLRVKTTNNTGAYLTSGPALVPTFMNIGCLQGCYKTPAAHVTVTTVYTNTQPTGPYRGAGRPEAIYVLERLIDIAAKELGIDRLELRRRNLIPSSAMPFQTAITYKFDSGDFAKNMDMALEMADVATFEQRRAEAKARGKLRGLGVIHMIEQAGGPRPEYAEIRFDPSGSVSLFVGTKAQGQGHETMYKIMMSHILGLDSDKIRIVDYDTDQVSYGMGTVGSRSALSGGGAIHGAAQKLIAKGRKIAAHMLETSESDIEFDAGTFRVAGTDKSLSIDKVAQTAFNQPALPKGMEAGFYENMTYTPDGGSFPNGCHVCEVEIDPDTGGTTILRYVAIDDVGTVVNALTLEGQVHGGIVQGAGQALFENINYDPESGQMRSGSFMDYGMPRAMDFCSFEVGNNPVPTPNNVLGIKGAGEAGTTGALACVMNAINDALSPFGVRHLEMPCTPEKVWRAIHNGRTQ
jgi:carbon-monoxide dehydrogenase large subunit